jgi:hypothetical protein
MRLLGQLSPAQRLQTMLEARELAVGLIRGRLHRRFPDLSQQEWAKVFHVTRFILKPGRTPMQTLNLWTGCYIIV